MGINTKGKINFEPTGDPFVDAGGMALKFWMSVNKTNSIIDIIEQAAKFYVNKWDSKINPLYLNSFITHPSKKSNEKICATVELYEKMMDDRGGIGSGNCRICGADGMLYSVGRDQFCLAGSKAYVNFHHSHVDGLYICKNCAVKLFFLPFVVMYAGGKLVLLQSTSENTQKYWMRKTVRRNIEKIGNNSSSNILKYSISNPRNSLFSFATEAILEIDTEYTDELNMYHFTNFGASPDCDIYVLPGEVFNFLAKILFKYKKEWFFFVRRFYHVKKTTWDSKEKEWVDKNNNKINSDFYRNNPNEIYERLLQKKSILPQFRKYAKWSFLNGDKFEAIIAIYYAMEVLNMEQKQIDLIKKISSTIMKIGLENDSMKKYVTMLEGAGKAYQLRGVLIKVIKQNFKNGEEQPVITLDDYVNYLFPDGQYWGEIRDMLLINIYEKMHENNIDKEIIPDHEIEATEVNTKDSI